jgi:hypothetical protein
MQWHKHQQGLPSNIFFVGLTFSNVVQNITPKLKIMQRETQHMVETILSFWCFRTFELEARNS